MNRVVGKQILVGKNIKSECQNKNMSVYPKMIEIYETQILRDQQSGVEIYITVFKWYILKRKM